MKMWRNKKKLNWCKVLAFAWKVASQPLTFYISKRNHFSNASDFLTFLTWFYHTAYNVNQMSRYSSIITCQLRLDCFVSLCKLSKNTHTKKLNQSCEQNKQTRHDFVFRSYVETLSYIFVLVIFCFLTDWTCCFIFRSQIKLFL